VYESAFEWVMVLKSWLKLVKSWLKTNECKFSSQRVWALMIE
jgi:hypothetical protein